MNNDTLKSIIANDFDKEKNYKRIMNRLNNKKHYKYALVPVFIVLIVFVSLHTGKNNVVDTYLNTNHESKDIININIINNLAFTSNESSLDAISKEDIMIPYFKELSSIVLPEDFDSKENYRVIYTRSDVKTNNYDVINNYEINYKNSRNDRNIVLSISKDHEILRNSELKDIQNAKKSIINNNEVTIIKYGDLYKVVFKYNNINYDIEAYEVEEKELIDLLNSIIV